MTYGLLAAVLILALMAIVGTRRSQPRANRRRKPRRRSRERSTDARPVRDDIAEYWGDALPEIEGSWEDSPALSNAEASASKKKPRRRAVRRSAITPVAPAEVAVGERACELGMAFLRYLTVQGHRLPELRGQHGSDVLESALDALRRRAPTRTLPHGAVAIELDEQHTLLFEPMAESVAQVERLLDANEAWMRQGTLYLVLGDPPAAAPAAVDAHIGPMLQRFDVPPTHFFLQEEDGSFHSFLEEQRDFVPYRIDAMQLPERFFETMLAYSEERFSRGEPEAALRTLGPLATPLWERVAQRADFDPGLLASSLNLLGAAYQAAGKSAEAVASLQSACALLKHTQDYESVQIVEANLGVTLLDMNRQDATVLRQAARHLQAAVRLDDRDVEAWRSLGDAFAARFDVERRGSLLTRAEHAYRQAQAIAPSERVAETLSEIVTRRDLHRSAEYPSIRNEEKVGAGQPGPGSRQRERGNSKG